MAATHIIGCLLGTAVGDALGLPYEGLSPQRAARMLGPPDRYRFFFRRGMVSDDTEHSCMVAQSLIASGGDVELFRRSLAWRLRFWLLGIPAGIGLATLRSILRLWLGYSPQNSGVFSAGNGPAMRAALLGAALDDTDQLREFVRVSSRMTHTDPKAEFGAVAVALAAQMARGCETVSGVPFLSELRTTLQGEGDELIALIEKAVSSVQRGETTPSFAESLGLSRGVSGYVYHTVPVAIQAWLSHPKDFRAAVTSILQCGGDTDSTAAIVGGIVGSARGAEQIPTDLLEGLIDWPCSVSYLKKLGSQLHDTLASGTKTRPIGLPFVAIFFRNLLFFIVVLFHGFRRLLPPY